jgi:hypothetical protein
MRVKAAQAPKASLGNTHALEVGQNYRASVSNYDVFDISVSIDERADLAVYLTRYFRELAGKLLRDNLSRRDAPLVKLFEALNLVML